jgi:transposase InsO family protein
LINLDPAKQIYVVSDASLVAGGGYIAQGETLESARPAVYHSRVFTPAQTNYPVHEQELLALVDIIKSYEHWLIGRPFTAYTDSQAMLSLMKQKHLSPRQWRAVTYLSKFDIQFEFIPGKKNIIADLLSRIAERSTYQHDLPYLEEDDTHLAAIQLRRGKTLLETPAIKRRIPKSIPNLDTGAPTGRNLPTAKSSVPEFDPDITPTPESSETPQLTMFSLSSFIPAILNGYKEDTQFSKALMAGVDSGVYVLDSKGLLYTGPDRDRLCIPNVKVRGGRDKAEKNLREMLIAHGHEAASGHLGTHKTTVNLRNEYYWKSLTDDVYKYVKSCHSCQMNKTSPTKQYGKNHPLPTATKPWQIVSMDFMTSLPSSAYCDRKFNSLYVVVDTLAKQTHLIPTTNDVKAEGVAKLYFEHIYKHHGLPRGIISDRDSKFTGTFWRTLQKMVGTDLMMSTTNHPQTDGQTERMNRSILQILRHFVNTTGSDWVQHLPTVEFAINSAVSRSTGKAPFEIVYGYLPRSFPPVVFNPDNPASMDFLENRMLSQLSAQDSIIAAKTEQSHHVNKHRKRDPEIAEGDMVAVTNETQLTHLPKGRQKLATKWVGPYKVSKADKSKSNYTLEIGDSNRHPTFHVSDIKRYADPHLELFPNRQRRQPRISESEQDLNLEIERIVGHERHRSRIIQFLCKWEGYPNEDNMWRAADAFKTSPYGIDLVKKYILNFGECPVELRNWVEQTDWIRKLVMDEWKRRGDIEDTTLSVVKDQPSHIHLRLGKIKKSGKSSSRKRGEDVGLHPRKWAYFADDHASHQKS